MTFIVEDGTGLNDANSGASVEDADAYFSDRNVNSWTGDSTAKESALVRATDYAEDRFVGLWIGEEEFPGVQTLAFPRLVNDVSTGVPTAYRNGIIEYALRALSGELAPDLTKSTSGLTIIAEGHKVGPIDDTFRYASKGAGSTPQPYRSYPSADAKFRSLLRTSSGVIR